MREDLFFLDKLCIQSYLPVQLLSPLLERAVVVVMGLATGRGTHVFPPFAVGATVIHCRMLVRSVRLFHGHVLSVVCWILHFLSSYRRWSAAALLIVIFPLIAVDMVRWDVTGCRRWAIHYRVAAGLRAAGTAATRFLVHHRLRGLPAPCAISLHDRFSRLGYVGIWFGVLKWLWRQINKCYCWIISQIEEFITRVCIPQWRTHLITGDSWRLYYLSMFTFLSQELTPT